MTPPSLFPPTLWNIGWRYLLRHRWQSALMVIGIALGVAVVVSIDLANASASRAFELSTESIAGRATHQITDSVNGLDESVYINLRLKGEVDAAAPVIDRYVSSSHLGSRPFELLGIDPFAEGPFRSYLSGNSAPSIDQLSAFLDRPGAVLLSRPVADRYGLKAGETFPLEINGRSQDVFIAGLLEPADSLSTRTLDGLILADIATAQELTGMIGRLDRIDLILPSGDQGLINSLSAQLPPGARLEPVAARSGTLEQISAAFKVNLTALSLLALVVGLFLIYNTMTFSVVQRRGLFGTLRSLGVTRREVFGLVLVEASIVGVIGSVCGIGLGILMGQVTVRMILQTINDLYFTTTVSQVGLPIPSLVKGGLVGVLATVLTAAPPAWEAASVPPQVALARSSLESKACRRVAWAALSGVLLIGAGIAIFLLPFHDLISGFGGTLAVVLGFALLTSLALVVMMKAASPLTGRLFGLLGRMAPRNLVNALSRTAVAVAALMIAVAVSIGVDLMTHSFRHTVILWLEQTLQSDIYISVPGFTATTPTAAIDPGVIQALQGWPGVARVDQLRSVTVASSLGPVQLSATDNSRLGFERLFLARDLQPGALWQALQAGDVVVSEPLANRLRFPRQGGQITLYANDGPHTFKVVGIYYDYASSQGTVTMALDFYRQLWQDPAVTALGLRLAPGVDVDATARALQNSLTTQQQLQIRPNRNLRQDVLAVFDRTFAITGALQVLATVVAFIGVLSALLLLQLEKQREIGILRAVGLTIRQLWGLVMLETGLMGLVAGLLAMPAGYALSLILIYVINRRSFGWTLQMALEPQPFLQALVVALAAALLAGIYPARRLGRMAAAEAIRYE